MSPRSSFLSILLLAHLSLNVTGVAAQPVTSLAPIVARQAMGGKSITTSSTTTTSSSSSKSTSSKTSTSTSTTTTPSTSSSTSSSSSSKATSTSTETMEPMTPLSDTTSTKIVSSGKIGMPSASIKGKPKGQANAAANSKGAHPLSPVAIGGIIAGVVFIVAFLAFGLFFCLTSLMKKHEPYISGPQPKDWDSDTESDWSSVSSVKGMGFNEKPLPSAPSIITFNSTGTARTHRLPPVCTINPSVRSASPAQVFRDRLSAHYRRSKRTPSPVPVNPRQFHDITPNVRTLTPNQRSLAANQVQFQEPPRPRHLRPDVHHIDPSVRRLTPQANRYQPYSPRSSGMQLASPAFSRASSACTYSPLSPGILASFPRSPNSPDADDVDRRVLPYSPTDSEYSTVTAHTTRTRGHKSAFSFSVEPMPSLPPMPQLPPMAFTRN